MNGARNTITFETPGEGPHVITPLSPLPAFISSEILDGLSQAGADASVWPPQLKIVIDGSAVGADAYGIRFNPNSDGFDEPSIMRGIVVQNFSAFGIRISGENITVHDCFVGTSVDGLAAAGNLSGGIEVWTGRSMNQIGSLSGEGTGRNLISGNGGPGILVSLSEGATILRGTPKSQKEATPLSQ